MFHLSVMGKCLRILFLLGVPLVCAQAASEDVRNTQTPNTDTHFQFQPPKTLKEWEARRRVLRNQILTAAGLLPMPQRTALHPQIFADLRRSGYSVTKVLLDTLPNYYLGGNLYRPAAGGRHPAVLLAHGHWTYGRLESQQLSNPQLLAGTLARLGFVVFMYDMVGYNDTIQTPHQFGGDSERLWSFGPLGLQLWNSIRALDFISSLPDVDASRVGMTGPSGGATQTLLLTAVDDRIKFSSPINMISAYMQGGDTCENAPGLRLGTNNVEIAALAAPNPMLVVSATGDWTKHVPQEEFPAIQQVYELYDRKANASVVQFDAPHNMNEQSRNAVERYFAKMILQLPEPDAVNEKGVPTESLNDMLALFNNPSPAHALHYGDIFEYWRKEAERQVNSISDLKELRDVLALTLGVKWPSSVASEKDGPARLILSRENTGDRVPVYFEHHGPKAVLVVDPDGADAGRAKAAQRKLAGQGQTLLSIDAFQTGSAVAARDRSHQHFLAFNLSDDSNRVQDVVTALGFLAEQGCTSVDLYGEGKAAWWVEFAAAVAPRDVQIRLHIPDQSLVDSEAAFLTNFDVPGILHAGGLRTADRLIKGRM